jgi:tetratricopeptide (TPR) repeat protein
MLARRKQYKQAEDQFKKAIRADCDYAAAYYALGVLNGESKKDYKAAAHYYKMYLLYDSTSPKAKRALVWLDENKKQNPKPGIQNPE